MEAECNKVKKCGPRGGRDGDFKERGKWEGKKATEKKNMKPSFQQERKGGLGSQNRGKGKNGW